MPHKGDQHAAARAEEETTPRTYSWARWVGASLPSERDRRSTAQRPIGAFGARYRLINEIGRGGMGVVSRALDRLTGRIVTVKQLSTAGGAVSDASRAEARALLAQEFRLLAALRHPNIISVLDYGFDDDQQPYLIMDLEENAQTIIEAGVDEPIAVRVDLLVQTLRALVYLHRIGIVHRDLKPDNILVVHGHVKVLDFGLSFQRRGAGADPRGWGGTPAYMAPEVLRGESPGERSDLYAVGMIAYELFTGSYPFDRSNPARLYEALTTVTLPQRTAEIDERVRPVLERLLARDQEERFGDASQVIIALAEALDRSLSIETVATRESFIQFAPLVGRDSEITLLREALSEATRGGGGTWLVAGESGVGKSRLLDELRTQALVDAVTVLRGQAVSRGGGPYHAWRDIVSMLILGATVNDADAEVLKTIVPDVAKLLGREVGDPPAVDSEAALTRLLFAVEELFRAQRGPVLVIAEDLQWMGSESLRLFSWLAQPAEQLPLLLVGSYRDDEAPDMPDAVKGAKLLRLERLAPEDVAALGEVMIGSAARRADVMQLLERESEGIPFFIVEVVRTLAEISGRLDRIGDAPLPEHVLSGGMQKIIRRRLNQVPEDALVPLRAAAVIGREIDVSLMHALFPDLGIEGWTAACARIAVLDLRDQRWRFAHDKLREDLLESIPPATVRQLHHQIADGIEHVYPDRPDYVPALAHHWHGADEPAREVVYARRAGTLALQNGACREAVDHLRRARDLLRAQASEEHQSALGPRARVPTVLDRLDPNVRVDPDGLEFELGRVENGLSEAYYRLGDLGRCREHSEFALEHFGHRVPSGTIGALGAGVVQMILRGLQVALKVRADDPARARPIASEAARAQLRLTDTYFYSLRLAPLAWSSLRVVNQCEPVGASAELAQGYIIMSLLASAGRMRRVAERWARRALSIAETTETERNVAWVLSRMAVLQISEGRWDEAAAGVLRAKAIAERVGDLRLWEEAQTVTGNVALYSGQFEPGLEHYRDAHRLGQRSGNTQVECWALLGQGITMSRLGRDAESIACYDAALALIDPEAMKTEALMSLGGLALSRLRLGDLPGAYEAADRAQWHVRAVKPIVYWLQVTLGAIAEVYLTLIEIGWAPDRAVQSALLERARETIAAAARFARHFPMGVPQARLWQGLAAFTRGRRRSAMRLWSRTLAAAARYRTPYEGARAHLEIGRHLPPEAHGRRHHLHQAETAFERLGCVVELGRVRDELARSDELLRRESRCT